MADYTKTGKSKTDLIRCYKDDLGGSEKWRKQAGYEDTWRLLIDLYRGKQFSAYDLSLSDKIMVNIAFATKNVIAPSVSINYPQFSVLARQPEQEVTAEVAEQALNFWWRRYNFHPEARRAVDDWLIVGHAWAKIGWRYETERAPIDPEQKQAMLDEQMAELDEAVAEGGVSLKDAPTDTDIEESLPSTVEVPTRDEPFVERVSPFDIFVDPEATCPADLRWIAQRIVLPVEKAKKNPGYKASARRKLEGDSALNPRWRDKDRAAPSVSDSLKRVTIYEFYDLANELYCAFAKDADDFLVDPQPTPFPFTNPFVMLRNYDVPDEFYPIGDLEMLEPIQRELNEIRSDMMNHRKRYKRAWVAKRQALDPEARRVLESDIDNRIVYTDDDMPLSEIIQPIPISSLDSQMYGYTQTIEGDVELVSGVSEYQRGAMSETRRTATEAAMIQDSVNARSQDKLGTLEIWLAQVGESVLKLMQTFLEGEQAVRIAGPEGQLWQTVSRDQIEGEFDYEVEAGSTQPRNESMRRQQALALANVMQPYVGSVVNPAEMAKYVLKEGFGIKDPEKFLVPPAPMMPPEMGGEVPGDPNALPMSGPNMDPRALLESQQAAPEGLD